MKKINKTQSFLALFLVLVTLILGSCSSSNEVVSNNIITKRKHNKGFHFDLKKNYASEKGSDLTKVEKITKEEKSVVSTEEVIYSYQENQISASLSDEIIEIENVVEENNEVNSIISIQKINKIEQVSSSKKDQKVNAKHVFKAAKRFVKHESNKDDTTTIILVILCFILPPLAVYLHEGSWNTNCWINLILTLLFWLPGTIHALIVCLK